MRRFRIATIAALSAGALLLAIPTSANAATGEFTYRTGTGIGSLHGLTNPPSEECLNLPGTSDDVSATRPRNLTLSVATVFLDFDCAGDVFFIMNPGKIINTNNLHIRSVVFS